VRDSAEFDTVVDQDPDAGEEAEEGSTVTLEVSNGPGNVRVPSVRNLPLERAVKDLSKVDLKVNVDRRPSESVREGFAIETVPREGTSVERGTRVRLFVSSGPEQVTVPDVVGLSRESAEGRLRDEGLTVAVTDQESDKPEEEVLAQEPAGGSRVDEGTRITITVSKGKQQVDVPNVVGLSAGDASRQLRAAGLRAVRRERKVTSEDEDGQVVDQRPAAGVEVDEGDEVVIFVGKFEEPQPEEPPAGGQPPPQ
jgi:eukaryotic-like serine/threonine-protein kinase